MRSAASAMRCLCARVLRACNSCDSLALFSRARLCARSCACACACSCACGYASPAPAPSLSRAACSSGSGCLAHGRARITRSTSSRAFSGVPRSSSTAALKYCRCARSDSTRFLYILPRKSPYTTELSCKVWKRSYTVWVMGRYTLLANILSLTPRYQPIHWCESPFTRSSLLMNT